MDSQVSPILQVAAKAAIINGQGDVLIVREAATGQNNTKVGHWGLVGGRLDPGEAFLDGLQREILEEVGLSVKPEGPLYVGEWRPVIRGTPHQIIAIFMLCRVASGDIAMSDEHDEWQWVQPQRRADFLMMEPDCYVVDMLR